MAKKLKDPAFLFYPTDFVIGCLDLDWTDKGKYIILLCIQHQKGRLSEDIIKKNIGDFSSILQVKFKKDRKGLWYNERLEFEIDKRKKHADRQRANVSKRWNKDTTSLPNGYQTDTKRIPLENRNINENISIRRTLFTKDVFVFSDKYPTELLNEFNSYWIEMNKSKTKMRYELQQTFEISRRLATWARNDKGYNKIEKTSEPITYKELLRRFNSGETDIWEQYERETINGIIRWIKIKPIE